MNVDQSHLIAVLIVTRISQILQKKIFTKQAGHFVGVITSWPGGEKFFLKGQRELFISHLSGCDKVYECLVRFNNGC